MMNWKNKFKKKKQNYTWKPNNETESIVPESGQDLIGDEWQIAKESYQTSENEQIFSKFENDSPRNQITLDELANPTIHTKAKERVVKLEELSETDPLYENSININGNRIEAKFQEFQKSIYLANTGIFFLILLSFVLKFVNPNVNNIFVICCAVICLVLFAFALLVYLINPTITVWLDENRNAIISCQGLFTSFKTKKIREWDLFYHLHRRRYNSISFLHLDLKFEDGCFFSISGKTFESLRNDRVASGAEDLQALGGEYTIQQIAKLLNKAKNCKRV